MWPLAELAVWHTERVCSGGSGMRCLTRYSVHTLRPLGSLFYFEVTISFPFPVHFSWIFYFNWLSGHLWAAQVVSADTSHNLKEAKKKEHFCFQSAAELKPDLRGAPCACIWKAEPGPLGPPQSWPLFLLGMCQVVSSHKHCKVRAISQSQSQGRQCTSLSYHFQMAKKQAEAVWELLAKEEKVLQLVCHFADGPWESSACEYIDI